jgi:2-hydroxychromene-2-carboxylate isomerase
MSLIKASIGRRVTALITSPKLQQFRRAAFSIRRKLSGQTATVHYFHQADDPYSQLLARYLPSFQSRYRVRIVQHPVPQPDSAAAPDPARLVAWSQQDAGRLASGLANPPPPAASAAEAPSGPAELQQGAKLRKKLGHYLGATLYFEGEWYWGVDRLHYLEARLTHAGLAVQPTTGSVPTPALVPPRALQFHSRGAAIAPAPVIHFYCSLRSPYTYLAARQVRQLAEHYGAQLRLRFVLPMVMRGLPVPLEKRLYILRDTKREATRLGMEFGTVVDPVGKPVERGLALLHAAIQMGKGSALLESFLEGVFAQGVDASSAQGLEHIAKRAGLSASDIQSALAAGSWRSVAEANRADMLARGIWGVPSFRVNDMPVLWGQDRLWMLEQDLIAMLHSNAAIDPQ